MQCAGRTPHAVADRAAVVGAAGDRGGFVRSGQVRRRDAGVGRAGVGRSREVARRHTVDARPRCRRRTSRAVVGGRRCSWSRGWTRRRCRCRRPPRTPSGCRRNRWSGRRRRTCRRRRRPCRWRRCTPSRPPCWTSRRRRPYTWASRTPWWAPGSRPRSCTRRSCPVHRSDCRRSWRTACRWARLLVPQHPLSWPRRSRSGELRTARDRHAGRARRRPAGAAVATGARDPARPRASGALRVAQLGIAEACDLRTAQERGDQRQGEGRRGEPPEGGRASLRSHVTTRRAGARPSSRRWPPSRRAARAQSSARSGPGRSR